MTTDAVAALAARLATVRGLPADHPDRRAFLADKAALVAAWGGRSQAQHVREMLRP